MHFWVRCFFSCFITATLLVPVIGQTSWRSHDPITKGDLIAIYFTSSDRGWVAGDDGFLASTTDGGKTWSQVELGTEENINEIYFRNDKNGYLVAGRKVFITSDGGNSWSETVLVKPGIIRDGTPEFLSIRFADRRRGIVVGSVLNRQGNVIDSLVMRTVDGGETWQRVSVPSRYELFHLDFVGSERVWIVGDRGVILASSDGGSTWIKQDSGTVRALYNVDFRDRKDGYAVGAGGTILRTESGGDNWAVVRTSFPATFMRVDFADDKNGWIVGHGGTILRSGDRGRSWVKQESSTDESLYGLFMMRRYGWAIGARGTLIQYLQ